MAEPGAIRLAVAVTHVPWVAERRQMVIRQRARIPDLAVIKDTARAGVWPTTRRAYLHLVSRAPDATHHLVLQDDFLPAMPFLSLVAGALAVKPDVPVALFTMRQVINQARDADSSWAVSPEGLWGGSTVIPAAWSAEFLAWERAHIDPDYVHDDRRLVVFLHHTGRLPVWHTVPSLLQHTDAPSALGHAWRMFGQPRQATWFERQPDPIDWTRGADAPVKGAGSFDFTPEWYRP